MKVTIYSKQDCHLCDEAKQLIGRFKDRYQLEIEILDIEQDGKLYEQYRYDIPVVFLNNRKIFKHRIDEKRLQDILKKEFQNRNS